MINDIKLHIEKISEPHSETELGAAPESKQSATAQKTDNEAYSILRNWIAKHANSKRKLS